MEDTQQDHAFLIETICPKNLSEHHFGVARVIGFLDEKSVPQYKIKWSDTTTDIDAFPSVIASIVGSITLLDHIHYVKVFSADPAKAQVTWKDTWESSDAMECDQLISEFWDRFMSAKRSGFRDRKDGSKAQLQSGRFKCWSWRDRALVIEEES